MLSGSEASEGGYANVINGAIPDFRFFACGLRMTRTHCILCSKGLAL